MSDCCSPMDCSPPGSSVHGIFQANLLEWIAISFSRGYSRPRDRTRVSCIVGRFFTDWRMESENESCLVVSDSLWPQGLYSSWNSLGQNTGVISLSLLQGIFPTQGSDPGLPHCRWILYQLSHQGSLMKVSGGSYFTVLSGQQRRAAHACLDSHPLTSV